MTYSVELTRRAEKDLRELPKDVQRRVTAALARLAEDPRPPGCRPLAGPWKGHYRIRVGDYRVIYSIDDERIVVTVIRVADRKEAY